MHPLSAYFCGMDNNQIADCFSLLAKLTDIHGENSFKAKSYATAAFTIEKLPIPLSETPQDKIFSIKGIGESTGKKIIELLNTGSLAALNEIIEKTPPGVLELMHIKGLGPKKIATIWKEMEIESVGELLYACKENRLKLYKGFGEKTQLNVMDTIEFYLKSQGSFLYAQIALMEADVLAFFEKIFPNNKIVVVGDFARQLEIIHELQLVIDATTSDIENKLASIPDLELLEKMTARLLYKTTAGLKISIDACEEKSFVEQVFLNNCSDAFASAFTQQFNHINYAQCADEAAVFAQAGLHPIAACQRESATIIEKAKLAPLPVLLQPTDIKGIIHSHSNWSDGNNTLEEMAKGAINKGFEYLVISDHSKSAFYANGLQEDRIQQQHLQIDALNAQLAPFKIFKSIESDILNDGSLDYSSSILSTFDLVIASVHSNLKMSEDKAMLRLMQAIENPYTTILGHLTGRLLLSRKGYPINHKKIIDACAANGVAIELNAHPSRLDMDWRHIDYAIAKNVLLSINPDAHSIEGFKDVQFGVLVAQKAQLTKEQNLSSFSLQSFEAYLANHKK